VSKKSNNVTLLITGAIRDGSEFTWILDRAIALRREGKIDSTILSTWKGEVERVPNLSNLIGLAGITLVESNRPVRSPSLDPRAHGHILFQKAALYYGLQVVAQGSFVIKARTDFIKERLESCLSTLMKRDETVEGKSVPGLVRPILEPFFTYDARVEWPFYWDDIAFTGTRDELLEMCDFDSKHDVIFDPADSPAEVRFFAGRFLKHYPVLEYGFANWKLPEVARLFQLWARNSEPGNAFKALPLLLQYWLEAQFHILSRYLILPDDAEDSEVLSKLRLRDFFVGTSDERIIPFSYPWECHKICSQQILRTLKDPTLPLEDMDMLELKNRLVALDGNPCMRGRLPGICELPDAEKEVQKFSERYGIRLFRHVRSQITISKKEAEVSFKCLHIPDRKPLTWLQKKQFGLRKLAERKYFQIIASKKSA
jgi:hypothetical protein